MGVIQITPNLSMEVTFTTEEILADLTYPESGAETGSGSGLRGTAA